jgi:hypothetical protein
MLIRKATSDGRFPRTAAAADPVDVLQSFPKRLVVANVVV